jgi:hypothetical protein
MAQASKEDGQLLAKNGDGSYSFASPRYNFDRVFFLRSINLIVESQIPSVGVVL